jgi:D-alanine-D-alanine ligase
VVETDDGPIVPAFIEYPVSEARPIREVEDKLQADGPDGALRQSGRPEAQPVCPAPVSPSLASALRDAALAAHRALGARHYSLFDFRVHRDTGVPVMLEAGLFWSFSELSAISKMLAAAGLDPLAVTAEVWRRAAA